MRLRHIVTLAVFVSAFASLDAAGDYIVKGMVLRVDAANRLFVVSHERIEGLMESMIMPFEVRDAKELQGVAPGAVVEFTLVVGDRSAHATRITVRRYESGKQGPRAAPNVLAVGQPVPEFRLVDQANQPVTLSALAGKVVAVNFVYTRCTLPQFCLRVSNNFGQLYQRFKQELSRGDLVLLTMTFDPERDRPEALATYAARWNADPATWRFLTGPVADVRRVTSAFGVDVYPDEGLTNHSLRTAVIDRKGLLAASVEGDQFTTQQLGDLVLDIIRR